VVETGGLEYFLNFTDKETIEKLTKRVEKLVGVLEKTKGKTEDVKEEMEKQRRVSGKVYRTWLPLMFAGQRLARVFSSVGGELNDLYGSTMKEAVGLSLMASYMDSTAGIMEQQLIEGVSDLILGFDELAPGVIGTGVKMAQFGAGLLDVTANAALTVAALGGTTGIMAKLNDIKDFFTTTKVGKGLIGAGGLALAIAGTATFLNAAEEDLFDKIAGLGASATGLAVLGALIGGPAGAAFGALAGLVIPVIIKTILNPPEPPPIPQEDINEAGEKAFGSVIWDLTPQFMKNMFGWASIFSDTVNIPISRQMGGYVPQEGIYHLHEGERVVSRDAGETFNMTGGFNITVNASVSSDYDVRQLAQRLGQELYNYKRTFGVGGLGGR
jgi:hypothetical protein